MPEPAREERRREKKDPFRSFTIPIDGISGINTTMPPTRIKDTEATAIYNFYPIAQNVLRKAASPLLDCDLVTQDALKVVNDVINGALVKWAILADGSMGTISGGVYTEVAPAGTFSTTAAFIDVTNWRNIVFLIADKNNGYFYFRGDNTAALTKPSSPTTGETAGGAIAETTYYIKVTYINSWGETDSPTEKTQLVHINNLLTVTSPAPQTGATGWNVYVSTATGTEKLQNTSPIAIGTNWTEPTSGLISGGYAPSCNTTGGFGLISSTLNGRSITVWQGRVFIVNGRVLNYSAPGSYTDFLVVDGGGFFTIAFTDLKEEGIKLSPYMDSFYIIGDHAIIAMTGTTISNDPNNWYQMEIFNNTGSLYGCLVVNWNNQIFLINEYGVWMIAATQSQKLDYKLDLSRFTVNNFYGTVAQIGNLNFFFFTIRNYSPLSFTMRDMLVIYCVELKEFYFLDFGFDIKGVYATLSETDHSIYVWGNNAVYKLFSGTGNVTTQINLKSFDLGDSLIYKAIRYLLIQFYIRSGTVSLTITGQASAPDQNKIQTATLTRSLSPALPFMAGWSPLFPSCPFLFTNTYGVAMVLTNSKISPYLDDEIFTLNIGGTIFSFIVKETSNAIYDLIKMEVKGFAGRRLIKP